VFLGLVNDVHREADAAMSVQEQQRSLLIQSEEKGVDLHDYGHPHRLAAIPLNYHTSRTSRRLMVQNIVR